MPISSRFYARFMGNLFVFLVICVMAVVYYPYVFIIWGPLVPGILVCEESHRKHCC